MALVLLSPLYPLAKLEDEGLTVASHVVVYKGREDAAGVSSSPMTCRG